VKNGTVTTRLATLPVLQKVIAALLMVACAYGCCALIQARAREYISSAVLSYDASMETEPAKQRPPVVAQAAEILDDQVQAGAAEELGRQGQPALSPNPFHGRDAGSWRNHLAISEISPTEIRVAWRARDAQQAQAGTQALASLLTSWHPQENDERRLLEEDSAQQDPKRNREEALLRVTIAMLDAKAAEFSAELRQTSTTNPQAYVVNRGRNVEAQPEAGLANASVKSGTAQNQQERRSVLERELERIHGQRTNVMGRLIELRHEDAHTQTSRGQLRRSSALQGGRETNAVLSEDKAETDSSRPSPFVLLEPASVAHPLTGSESGLVITGGLAGIAGGVLYLALAIWWFRPIRDIAALETILGRDILLVGTIAEIRQ
jgi:hypothetical protein